MNLLLKLTLQLCINNSYNLQACTLVSHNVMPHTSSWPAQNQSYALSLSNQTLSPLFQIRIHTNNLIVPKIQEILHKLQSILFTHFHYFEPFISQNLFEIHILLHPFIIPILAFLLLSNLQIQFSSGIFVSFDCTQIH